MFVRGTPGTDAFPYLQNHCAEETKEVFYEQVYKKVSELSGGRRATKTNKQYIVNHIASVYRFHQLLPGSSQEEQQ